MANDIPSKGEQISPKVTTVPHGVSASTSTGTGKESASAAKSDLHTPPSPHDIDPKAPPKPPGDKTLPPDDPGVAPSAKQLRTTHANPTDQRAYVANLPNRAANPAAVPTPPTHDYHAEDYRDGDHQVPHPHVSHSGEPTPTQLPHDAARANLPMAGAPPKPGTPEAEAAMKTAKEQADAKAEADKQAGAAAPPKQPDYGSHTRAQHVIVTTESSYREPVDPLQPHGATREVKFTRTTRCAAYVDPKANTARLVNPLPGIDRDATLPFGKGQPGHWSPDKSA